MKIGSQIEHNDIKDIAMTKGATFIVTEAKIESLPSIISEQSENRDLIHFYKENN